MGPVFKVALDYHPLRNNPLDKLDKWGGLEMKANKWVAVLAAGSMLAIAAPLSAQFGGFKSLKKAMDTVAKELEQPKPAPQPQPTARPTPPQSRPATSQGGYASPAPQPRQRTEQVQTPIQYQPSAVQQARVAPKREVVATEVWRCLQEPDATPIKLEFNYVRDEAGQRLGSFTQTYTYEYEGKETETPTISKGIFRSAGASYRLKYDDPELGQIELVASQKDSENGTILSTSRYTEDYPSMRDVETITQKFTDAQIKMFEATADDNPDGGIPLQCKLIKPIFSKYSFDDFYVDRPTAFFEGFREDPKQPQFAGRDINFRNIRTMLSEAVTNHWYTPKFGKYFIVVSGGKHMAQYAYLIDMRSGKVHELFMETIEGGGVLDYKITENSNMVLSITADPEKNYCNLNYSKWNGSALELIQTERLGAFQTCLNEYGTFPQPNYLQAIEDQYLQRNVPGETQANASKAPLNAQIVSAEVWNCFSDESPKPIRFELNYASTQKKNERGSFREVSPFDNEGIETRTPNVSSGSFRYEQTQNGDVLKLEYADQSKEYRSFTSSVLDDGARFGEMDNLQCELVK